MTDLASKVRNHAASPTGKKLAKYSAVSGLSVVVTFSVQVFCYGVLHTGAVWSAIIASTVAAVPSYFLNRMWVWGKGGKSHVMKEVVPFWVMTGIGLACSMGVSALTDNWAQNAGTSHLTRTFLIPLASLFTFGVLWILKYIIFNKVLFAHRENELDPTLDGRTGLPT